MKERQNPDLAAEGLDWVAVGGYLRQAMAETAEELGGEEFRDRVLVVSESGDVLPNPAALVLLSSSYEGSAELAIKRASQIRQEIQARQLAEAERPSKRLKLLGRSMLRMFG